jgi:hypothetical protein
MIKRVHAYVGNESEFEGGAWASQTYEVFSRVDANVESECDDGARSTARQTEQWFVPEFQTPIIFKNSREKLRRQTLFSKLQTRAIDQW